MYNNLILKTSLCRPSIHPLIHSFIHLSTAIYLFIDLISLNWLCIWLFCFFLLKIMLKIAKYDCFKYLWCKYVRVYVSVCCEWKKKTRKQKMKNYRRFTVYRKMKWFGSRNARMLLNINVKNKQHTPLNPIRSHFFFYASLLSAAKGNIHCPSRSAFFVFLLL